MKNSTNILMRSILFLSNMNEDEHIELSESLIEWIEDYRNLKSQLSYNDDNREELEEMFREKAESLKTLLPPMSFEHELSPVGLAWSALKLLNKHSSSSLKTSNEEQLIELSTTPEESEQFAKSCDELDSITSLINELSIPKSHMSSLDVPFNRFENNGLLQDNIQIATANLNHDINLARGSYVRMRGTDEWAPPRAQIIFNIPEEYDFKKAMLRQNYRCSGCGMKIDLGLARKSVLYCHYLGKYFCKCCFSHKSVHLPGYILQKWDFHKYPVSQFALQLLNKIANEPLFNINDINPQLYRKVKKLRHLVDLRMQLYYLKIYISSCIVSDKLSSELTTFTHQHLLQSDVHVYSLNDIIEIQHGKLYEYLNDLVTRSMNHITSCDSCMAKGHYDQLRMITQISQQSKSIELQLK